MEGVVEGFLISSEDSEALVNLILDLWDTNYGIATYEDGILRLVTGGWSENEEIIQTLKQNFYFMSKHWVGEIRGGAYWFEIKRDWNRNPTIVFYRSECPKKSQTG